MSITDSRVQENPELFISQKFRLVFLGHRENLFAAKEGNNETVMFEDPILALGLFALYGPKC